MRYIIPCGRAKPPLHTELPGLPRVTGKGRAVVGGRIGSCPPSIDDARCSRGRAAQRRTTLPLWSYSPEQSSAGTRAEEGECLGDEHGQCDLRGDGAAESRETAYVLKRPAQRCHADRRPPNRQVRETRPLGASVRWLSNGRRMGRGTNLDLRLSQRNQVRQSPSIEAGGRHQDDSPGLGKGPGHSLSCCR